MHNFITEKIEGSIEVKKRLLTGDIYDEIMDAAALILRAFKNGHKLLICGNGGSAADALHIAAEFTGRFYDERAPLPAIVLGTNMSSITAISNDYNYAVSFSRELEALGTPEDILLCISTSGNSENILAVAKQANIQNVKVIALTGNSGGKLAEYADLLIRIPSTDVPRIQECHILLGHIICEWVEKEMQVHG